MIPSKVTPRKSVNWIEMDSMKDSSLHIFDKNSKKGQWPPGVFEPPVIFSMNHSAKLSCFFPMQFLWTHSKGALSRTVRLYIKFWFNPAYFLSITQLPPLPSCGVLWVFCCWSSQLFSSLMPKWTQRSLYIRNVDATKVILSVPRFQVAT